MSKEMWIDRDECMLWFDVKPTYEALGHTAGDISSHVAKVQVSDAMYKAYQKHCKESWEWQQKLSALYLKEKS